MEKEYTVWVGGMEVNDHYLTKESALKLADEYLAEGYEDVSVEKVSQD